MQMKNFVVLMFALDLLSFRLIKIHKIVLKLYLTPGPVSGKQASIAH